MTLSKLRFAKMSVGSLRRAHKLSNLAIDNLCLASPMQKNIFNTVHIFFCLTEQFIYIPKINCSVVFVLLNKRVIIFTQQKAISDIPTLYLPTANTNLISSKHNLSFNMYSLFNVYVNRILTHCTYGYFLFQYWTFYLFIQNQLCESLFNSLSVWHSEEFCSQEIVNIRIFLTGIYIIYITNSVESQEILPLLLQYLSFIAIIYLQYIILWRNYE